MGDFREHLDRLVDRRMYLTDATYNAQVALCRRWLEATKMAMEDEGVPDTVAERVLSRLVYGAPSSDTAYTRQELFAEQVKDLSMTAIRPFHV
jgi:hypothetical protein